MGFGYIVVMSILVKRRRGRPRLDESKVISDFDSNLIDEMKKYPILYDRGHKHYKDKAMVNSYWKRVGSGLNVSENVVRNRIFQLRNRYNIEKRRMETNPSVPTSWPLYESLGFLFDFTKRGRRFVMQTKTANGHTAATPSDEEEDEEDIEEEQYVFVLCHFMYFNFSNFFAGMIAP